jgi:hypothetical protein
MEYSADVGLVNAHPEALGGHHDRSLTFDEGSLLSPPGPSIHHAKVRRRRIRLLDIFVVVIHPTVVDGDVRFEGPLEM